MLFRLAFILATTELHKLPSTIVSRCQRFDFRRIATPVLMERLAYIADREGIAYEQEALRIIAKMAQGGMRDSISLFELCASSGDKITAQVVNETLGYGGRETMDGVVRAISARNFDAIFTAIDNVVRSSKDVSVFWQELLSFYRDMLVIKTTAAADQYLDLTESESEQLKKTAALFTKETLLYHCRVLDDALYAMQKTGRDKRTIAEMALIKMGDASLDAKSDAILSRLSQLETAVASGISFASKEPVADAPKVSVAPKAQPKSEPVSAPQPAFLKQEDGQESLRVLRGWNEVVEKAAAGDVAVQAFMRQGKAFTDGQGRIHIRFPNDFAKSMVDRSPHKETIRAILRTTLQRDLLENELIFGILDGAEENDSDLDDLML